MEWLKIAGIVIILGSFYVIYAGVNGGSVDRTVDGFLFFLVGLIFLLFRRR